jgi:DNA repair protein RecO (recombination protein O)
MRPLNLSLCFFFRLIATLGYRPSLNHCAKCNAQTGLSAFDIKRGGVLCKKCFSSRAQNTFKLQLGDIKVLQRCLSLPISKITSINIMHNQVKTLLPLFFQLAKYHLDIQVNSEKFLYHLLKLDSK